MRMVLEYEEGYNPQRTVVEAGGSSCGGWRSQWATKPESTTGSALRELTRASNPSGSAR